LYSSDWASFFEGDEVIVPFISSYLVLILILRRSNNEKRMHSSYMPLKKNKMALSKFKYEILVNKNKKKSMDIKI